MVSIQPVQGVCFKSNNNLNPNRNVCRESRNYPSKTGAVIGNIGWVIMSVGLLLAAAKGISTFAEKAKQNTQSEIKSVVENVENTETTVQL